MAASSLASLSIYASKGSSVPLYASFALAGLPSSADDYLEAQLDLNELLVKRPAATYFMRVRGNTMKYAGIHAGDLLVVDRSVKAIDGKIIVAALNGCLSVKRLHITFQGMFLVPENPMYPALEVTPETDFYVWGVVTSVIRSIK